MRGLAHALHCYQERFLVSKGDDLFSLHADEVSCFLRDDRQVRVITPQGKQYAISISLTDLEQKLDPGKFFRINRQCIAHIDHIKKISFFSNFKLKVHITGCDDDNIIVSKERTTQFKAWLNT